MAIFDLPATSADAPPEFIDAKACAEWLQTLPLINVAPAHGALLAQIEDLNTFDLPAAERLKILETLREPVFFVQTEHSKKFAGRALPLSKAEREIFVVVCALWDALLHGYQHCIEGVAAGTLVGQGALACQRALDCVAQKMVDQYKAYQEIGGDDWRAAHKTYRFAESRKVLDNEVSDPMGKASTLTSCNRTWVRMLLLNLASPNEQSPRQVGIIAKWLEGWSGKITPSATRTAGTLPPLVVDLDDAKGATRDVLSGDGVRFLPMDELGGSLQKRIGMLRKGEPAASVKLGEECVQPYCEQLLSQLYRHWCEGKNAREQPRKNSTDQAQAISGIGGIHHYITGLPFKQPGQAKELTKQEREQIATFGRVSTRDERDYSAIHGFALEQWTLLDESLTGLRMFRPAGAPGGRLAHTQLIGVRPADSRHFMLGTVRWLLSSQDLDLHAGIRLAPGVPQAVAIKPTGLNASMEKYIPALALPALPALQSPASLIIPAGWFRAKRVIEVWRDAPEQVMLMSIIERGTDFERVAFEPI